MSLHQFPCVPFVSTMAFVTQLLVGHIHREIDREQIAFRLYILYVIHVCIKCTRRLSACVCARPHICMCVRLLFVRDAYL